MRIFLIGITFFLLNTAFSQCPFNYGQNKKIYFISTGLRSKLALDSIYTVEHSSETGGMGENWDVTTTHFNEDYVSEGWYPISLDSTFIYRFDSIRAYMQYLNGSRYVFSNGKLKYYGGEGYGTFDWKEVIESSDSVSIIETSCTGHCGGNFNTSYSKNVFNKKGQLIYTVFYPEEDEDAEQYEEEETKEEVTAEEYERAAEGREQEGDVSYVLLPELDGNIAGDTIYYRYDKKGLLLNTNKSNSIKNKKQAQQLFADPNIANRDLLFHQCYIGEIEMEKYMADKIGYAPDLIIIELYRHAVCSFWLNPVDKKYYESNFIILEQ